MLGMNLYENGACLLCVEFVEKSVKLDDENRYDGADAYTYKIGYTLC